MVLCGFVIACLFAGAPTLRSPFFINTTMDGVVRLPSSLAITTGSLPSITATQLFVVPKSIPMIFPIIYFSFYFLPTLVGQLLIVNDYAGGIKVQKCQEIWPLIAAMWPLFPHIKRECGNLSPQIPDHM